MTKLKILLTWNAWFKLIVIMWWSIVIGSYLCFLSYVQKTPRLDYWICSVATLLFGGAGMNYITSLYKIPLKDFHAKLGLPPFFMSIGFGLLVLGVILGAVQKESWTLIVSLVSIFAALFFIVWGADTDKL